ncbi:type IV secretory pathway VirB10-like protein [Variovorax sp. SG517]|uniref:hypothetical protein n=2 Tax=unclassified Variovorax TaxID=663243 RepID=UPI00159E10E1|nr:hypothetical protein [Variovorax sp. SG517]NVM88706.1 type IV secretory pathway VirB10-like protein [Variovorax sp. SG517]
MAVVATVIALHGRPVRAADAAEAKPCRTPCLSANVPREPAESSGAGKAEKADKADKAEEMPSKPKPAARARPQPVAPPPSAPPPVQREAAAAPRPAPSKRCSEINMRAAVGEPLSDQDMKTLRSQC